MTPDLPCVTLAPVLRSPVLLKVYCSDHTYTTIRIAVAATGREVISAVADKLGTADELLLVHLSSAGGKNEDGFQYKEYCFRAILGIL